MIENSEMTHPNGENPPKTEATEPSWIVGAVIIVLTTFAAYWPSIKGGFVWDDLILVLKNPLVTGTSTLGDVWFKGDFSLTTVATGFEWLLFGKNPFGYRVVNLLLHTASALLLWRILRRLQIRGAWFAAALFALHPVCVASVAWISELKNTLSLPLFLLSLLFYLKSENHAGSALAKKPLTPFVASILFFLLALMAKTSTVMLPALLLLIAWWQRGRIGKRDWLKTSAHFALAITFGLMTVWFQTHQAIRAVTAQSENFIERLFAAALAVWFYLWKACVPVNLCMIYPRWSVSGVSLTTLLPLLLWGVAVFALWRFLKQCRCLRPVFFTLTGFTIVLFPVLGFFDMYFMVFSRVSDHFNYLPLVIVTPLIGLGLSQIPQRRVCWGVSAAIGIAFFLLTHQRAEVFRSDESLWSDTVAKNPNAWNAHNNLACNLAERGEIGLAMDHFARSLELNPINANAQRNYATALAMKGRFAEAEPHFRAALEQKPGDAKSHASFAEALARNGRLTEATEHYRQALNIEPDFRTRLSIAPLLAATGRAAEAVVEFRAVLNEQPDSVEALNNLAWILATSSDETLRNGGDAVLHAERAWKLTGGKEATMLGTLAAAYAEAGQFTNAIIASQQAITLAQKTGNAGFARMNQQLQQLYRAGRAYHERPRAASTNVLER